MAPFKPAEIRIIIALSILAILGSVATLLHRQNRLSGLNLTSLAAKSRYPYSFNISRVSASDSAYMRQQKNPADADTLDEIINLNTSGYYDLETLPGIGPVMAARIISYRDSVGAFKTVEELKKVKGIGPIKYAAIKDKVTIK